MVDDFLENGSAPSRRSLAVALVTITRYLAGRDRKLVDYLQTSLAQAQDSSLTDDDLAYVRTLISAIGGS